MKPYEWNPEKSKALQKRHGISFEDILNHIKKGDIVQIITHPNQKKYPGQKIFIMKIQEYIYTVPYIEDEQKRFLKTLYPNRKFTKKFLKERKK